MRLKIKNYNLILLEKQQEYQHYHVGKLEDMKILQVKKYYLLSSLGKTLEKQKKKGLKICLKTNKSN